MIEGTIKGGLCVLWKTTAGQFPHLQVIGDALATEALSGTRVIRAVASLKVFLLVAFHSSPPSLWSPVKKATVTSQRIPASGRRVSPLTISDRLCASLVKTLQERTCPRGIEKQYIGQEQGRQRHKEDRGVHQHDPDGKKCAFPHFHRCSPFRRLSLPMFYLDKGVQILNITTSTVQ
jgi:hypothetical protein